MHALMMRLCRLFANLTHLIVSLSNPRALKIPKTQAAKEPHSFQTKCVIETELSEFHLCPKNALSKASSKTYYL